VFDGNKAQLFKDSDTQQDAFRKEGKKLYHHTMEMQQMMERLLAKMDTNQAEIRTNQAKTDASLREMREVMLAKMETSQERMDAKIDPHHERMMAKMDYQLEEMEAADLGPNAEEIRV
jgi:hypothetical protein